MFLLDSEALRIMLVTSLDGYFSKNLNQCIVFAEERA